MPLTFKNRYVWLLWIAILFLTSTIWYQSLLEFPKHWHMVQVCQCQDKEPTRAPEEKPPTELQLKISEIFHKIEQSLPNVTISSWKNSTSGKNSKGSIKNPKDKYCVGDVLTVQYDMYDHLDNRKTYGGDFLRPRIFTPELGAGATGRVDDFNNGTYHIHFTLFWEGRVKVSTQLFHPSEGITALWRSRHSSLGVLGFQGRFKNVTKVADTECGFKLETDQEVCEYIDHRDEEAFYCIRPANMSCGSLNEMRAMDLQRPHLNTEEQLLFQRSNIGVEITKNFQYVDVRKCDKNIPTPTEKCKTGMASPYPSGYFLQHIWYPVFCKMAYYNSTDNFIHCLKGKRLLLIGDSTLRQVIVYLTENMKIMKYFDHHGGGWMPWQKTILAINMDNDTMVSYKRHGFPLESFDFYLFKDDQYTSRQIDVQSGDRNTIFVITMGQHFRQFPLKLYIRRALNIRKAIERLLTRSPDAKVIIKTENTRDTNTAVERLSDFHGYCQYLVLREVFKDLNVGFVDAFDMTYALATENVHPPLPVLANIVSLILTYAC